MSAELMESKFVRRLSVASIISEPIVWISFKFLFLLCLGHIGFLNFWKKNDFWIFCKYFWFSLTWDPMRAKISKHYSLKSLLTLFKLFLKFLLSCPYKSTVLDFWNFEFMIFQDLFFVFVNMGPYGSKNFKMLLLPQFTFESFKLFLKFLLSFPHKSYCFWIFEILSLRLLMNFFRFR